MPAVDLSCFKMVSEPVKMLVPKGVDLAGVPYRLEKKRVSAVDLSCFKMVSEAVKTLAPKGVDLAGTHIDWRRNECQRWT